MSEVKNVFKNYINLSITTFCGAIFTLISFAILARKLGPDRFGTYNLFLVVTNIFIMFSISWLINSLVRFGKEEFIKEEKLNENFWSLSLILLITFFLCVFALGIFRKQILSYINGTDIFFLYFIALYLLLYFIFSILGTLHQTLGKIEHFSYMQFLQKFSFLVIVLVILFLRKSFNLNYIIFFLSLTFLVGIWFALLKLEKKKKLLFPPSTTKFIIKRIISSITLPTIKKILFWSLPLLIGTSGAVVLSWTDTIIVRLLMTVKAVGIYSIASRLFQQSLLFLEVFSVITLPLFASLRFKNKQGGINFYLSRIVPQLVLCVSLLSSIIILFGSKLIPLIFGIEYKLSVVPFAILFFSMSFLSILKFCASVITVYDYLWSNFVIGTSAACLNILLNYLFIKHYGLVGASSATAVVYILESIVILIFISIKFKIANQTAFFAALPVIPSFVLFLATESLLFRAAGLLIILLATILFARMLKLFQPEDKVFLENIDMPAFLKNMLFKVFNFCMTGAS